nr:phosphatidate cytidylyltransferase [Tenebrionicola larvae]
MTGIKAVYAAIWHSAYLARCRGFAGGLRMSVIKRDRGIKVFGGMMVRVDSLCFAAPVFFYVVRYFYTCPTGKDLP